MARQKSGERKWRGELTIARVAELKEELSKALENSDRLLVDLSEATEIDSACLQLLCSAHRTAVRQGKEMSLRGTEALAPILREAGFVRHIGCALDCNQSCIWAVPDGNGREDL